VRRNLEAIVLLDHTHMLGHSQMRIVIRRFPPIVHVAGRDTQSDARWEAWRGETCPTAHEAELELVCKAENVALLKAADLGS